MNFVYLRWLSTAKHGSLRRLQPVLPVMSSSCHSSMGQTKILQLSRNTLNTNLMQGHRDSSMSPCSLPEMTENIEFFTFYFNVSKSG